MSRYNSEADEGRNMMMCAVILGYRGGDDPGTPAWISVSKDALILKCFHDEESFVFTPEDVVEIRIVHSWFMSEALIIDHVLFEKMRYNVVVSPSGESCELLLARIRMAGFLPKAQPMIPWEPPESPSPFV